MAEEVNETSTLPILPHLIRNRSPSPSPITGPGLAKPVSNASTENPSGQQRIDAALEKNLETIVTQVRRTVTTKTSELNENDLQLFDSPTASTIKSIDPSREMTPDSINEETPNGFHPYSQPSYGQLPWPTNVYPYTNQHPGLFLPYPPFYAHPFVSPPAPPLALRQLSEQKTPVEENSTDSQRLFPQFYPSMPNYPLVTLSPYQSAADEMNLLSSNAFPATNRELLEPESRLNKSSLHQTFSRLSPELSSDGGNNDADSIISFESQKSTPGTNMPVLEDGLSDSEETSSTTAATAAPTRTKPVARHQSTQIDAPVQHRPTIPSNKSQFARSTTATTTPVAAATATMNTPSKQSDRSSTATPGSLKTVRKKDYDTDEETDKLLGIEHRMNARNQDVRDAAISRPLRPRPARPHRVADPENASGFIEGVLYRCRYLGSTQLVVENNPTKVSRMMQAQEVVDRIKAPDGEHQPSVEVDLFISIEKIMVLNTDLEDILMDHSLRSISYIADIGDLVVLMAKRRYLQHDENDDAQGSSTSTRRMVTLNQKMVCHVFESDEAQSIAHSIGQAFQVAYVEFLKANGIDDPSFTRDIDYQEVLDQQELASEELDRFARKECQKEAIVTKAKNEPLGIVIVESGWGSMLPTVVIANMMPGGPAARGGQLNIGDQIISVNGISLVGLPLSSCQTQIKNVKHLTTVRLLVVPCPPVVEVLIRRPDTKYQLGFSVQNGIICSLLRGGIAERGGVRVGHRIIEINGQSVVATSHERIVNMLSHSVGELRMKTMPTQMYRLLTGQETPTYI